MIGWLKRLFTGEPNCAHAETEVVYEDAVVEWDELVWEVHLRCKACGYIRKVVHKH